MTADHPAHTVRRFELVALWLPAAVVAIAVTAQLLLLPNVPPTVAVHWNAAGEADGFAPAWTQPIATTVLGLGVPVLLAVTTLPGLRRGERGTTYRLLGALAAALSAFIAVAFTTTFAMQAGLEAFGDAPAIWPALVAALVAGLLAGLAGWALQPRHDATTVAPAAEPALAVGATERVAWVRTAAMPTGAVAALLLGVLGVALAAIVAWVTGASTVLATVLTVVAAVMLVLATTTIAFHVRIDDTGLRVTSLFGIPRFRVPLADVASAARVEVDPMGEFGGWGLRAGAGRRFGVVLRRGEAIEVTRRSGRRFVVTVDDARTGAALLEALTARASARS